MKILITGGCGFLGTNMAEAILSRNLGELIILDNLSRRGSAENLAWLKSLGQFKYCEEDVRREGGIVSVIRETCPAVIIHLAGQVAMTTSITDPRLDFETNALGTLNVLEAARKYSPAAVIIYSSTNKVYGSLEWVKYREEKKRYVAVDYENGFGEEIPIAFHSPYGCSKGCADQYMLDYHRIYGLKTVVFRHSSMFGRRQFSTYDQGWIGWFCRKAWEGKKTNKSAQLTISGNGKQVRDVLFADDMIELYTSVFHRQAAIYGQAFNIGGGVSNGLSLLELFEVLEEETGVKINYTELPFRPSDQKVFVANIAKAFTLLNWQPRIDKLTGIRKMLEWIEQNG